MKTKTIRGVAVKAMDDEGHGLARIAVMSAVDSDGDTYAPGAFGEQWASIQPAHNWGSVMLGKARVYEEGDEALAELHFNLDTEIGKEWHSALKFDLDGCCQGAPAIQEWSYGFGILDAAQETREGERVRVLKRLDVIEVSPVLRGAGVGTATLALKHGQPFEDQTRAVAHAVRSLTTRTKAAMGTELSPDHLVELVETKRALDALKESAADLETLIVDAAGDPGEADRLFAAFEAIRCRKWLGRDLGGCCEVDGDRIKGRRLGALLRRLRDEQERSNDDLAGAAGVDTSTMGSIIAGEINCPPLSRLSGLAELLDVPVSQLRSAAEDDGCEYE